MTAAQQVLGVVAHGASWGYGWQAGAETQAKHVAQGHILHGALAFDERVVLVEGICCFAQAGGNGDLMLLSDCVGVDVGEDAERGLGGLRS